MSNERLVYESKINIAVKSEPTRRIPRRLDKIDRAAIREGNSIDFMRKNAPFALGRALAKSKASGDLSEHFDSYITNRKPRNGR